MDREACWATVHGGHKESDKTERLMLSLFIGIQLIICQSLSCKRTIGRLSEVLETKS